MVLRATYFYMSFLNFLSLFKLVWFKCTFCKFSWWGNSTRARVSSYIFWSLIIALFFLTYLRFPFFFSKFHLQFLPLHVPFSLACTDLFYFMRFSLAFAMLLFMLLHVAKVRHVPNLWLEGCITCSLNEKFNKFDFVWSCAPYFTCLFINLSFISPICNFYFYSKPSFNI
jgi:hypothetical protein